MIVTEEGKNIYPGRHRSRFRRPSGQGILRFRSELHLAQALHGRRTADHRHSSGNRQPFTDELKQDIITAQQSAAQLQAGSRHRSGRRDFPRTASLKIKRSELPKASANSTADRVIAPAIVPMAASKDRFLAIVNPAAGGGRSAKLAGPALARPPRKGPEN